MQSTPSVPLLWERRGRFFDSPLIPPYKGGRQIGLKRLILGLAESSSPLGKGRVREGFQGGGWEKIRKKTLTIIPNSEILKKNKNIRKEAWNYESLEQLYSI